MRIKKATARRLAAAVGAVVVGFSIVVMPAAPASANDGHCGPGDLCLFDGYEFTAGQWDASDRIWDYVSGHRWWGSTDTINDDASSLRCRYSFFSCEIYEHHWFTGDSRRTPPGGGRTNLGVDGFDQRASSNALIEPGG